MRAATTLASLAIVTALLVVAIASGQTARRHRGGAGRARRGDLLGLPEPEGRPGGRRHARRRRRRHLLRGPAVPVLDRGRRRWRRGDHERHRARRQCTKPSGIQRLVFAKTEYPNIRRHFRAALRSGWPRRLIVNRPRRRRAPRPAAGGHPDTRRLRPRRIPAGRRARQGQGLERGRNPRGWKATCATSPARRTARTAPRSAPSSPTSATARASATCSGSHRGNTGSTRRCAPHTGPPFRRTM